MLEPFFARLRTFHDRHARTVLAAIASLMLPLMVMTTVATLDNWRQDKDRDALASEQGRLLACFNDFAAASSASSKAVRIASAAKDDAAGEFTETLNVEGLAFKRLIGGILDKSVTPEDVKNLYDTLDARAKAGRQLDRAQAALDKARRDNPIPPPPSEFCGSAD